MRSKARWRVPLHVAALPSLAYGFQGVGRCEGTDLQGLAVAQTRGAPEPAWRSEYGSNAGSCLGAWCSAPMRVAFLTLCSGVFAIRQRRRGRERSARNRQTDTLKSCLRASRGTPKTGLMTEEDKERMRQIEGLVGEEVDVDTLDMFDGPSEPSSTTLEVNGVEFEWTPTPRYADVRSELPRLPFLPEPGYRAFAGNTPGDAGFDPLGLCTDLKKFVLYREAEIKHGRLAMIAAIAWPLVEIEEPIISQRYRLPDVLAESGGRLAPTFTGGLEDQFVEAILFMSVFVGGSFELVRDQRAAPGDLGADPFNLAKWKPPSFLQNLLPAGRTWNPEAELQHGRFAMMVLIYDVLDEALTGNTLDEDTDYFFHRLDVDLFRWDYWLGGVADLAASEDVSNVIATGPS